MTAEGRGVHGGNVLLFVSMENLIKRSLKERKTKEYQTSVLHLDVLRE